MAKQKLALVPPKPKPSPPTTLEPVTLAFAEVVQGGEFSVETEDLGTVRLVKLPHPEPLACLPPGSAYRHLNARWNKLFSVIAVNSQVVAPAKHKNVYFRVPDDEGVLFHRKVPIRQD